MRLGGAQPLARDALRRRPAVRQRRRLIERGLGAPVIARRRARDLEPVGDLARRVLDRFGEPLPDVEQRRHVGRPRDDALELEQRRLVLRRDPDRLLERRAGLRRVVHVLAGDPRLLEQQVGALVVVARVRHLGRDQLDQVRPQPAAIEHAPDRPQVGAQPRIECQRAAVGLHRARLVGEPALVQLAELVGEHRGRRAVALRLELLGHRLGARLAAGVAQLVERPVEHRGRVEVDLERLIDHHVGDPGRDLDAAGRQGRGVGRPAAHEPLDSVAERRRHRRADRPLALAALGARHRNAGFAVAPGRGLVRRRGHLDGRHPRQRRIDRGRIEHRQVGRVGASELCGLALVRARRDRHRRRPGHRRHRDRRRRTRHQRRPRAQRRDLQRRRARWNHHDPRNGGVALERWPRRRQGRRHGRRRAKRQRRARRRLGRVFDLLDLLDLERFAL